MTKALMRQAAQMCKREHEEEIEELGLLPPSHNIDPLNPPLTMCARDPLHSYSLPGLVEFIRSLYALQCRVRGHGEGPLQVFALHGRPLGRRGLAAQVPWPVSAQVPRGRPRCHSATIFIASCTEHSLSVRLSSAGLGRLITFCLDAATSHGRSGVVHVLEANPRAVGKPTLICIALLVGPHRRFAICGLAHCSAV
jgi:hypothetical protein